MDLYISDKNVRRAAEDENVCRRLYGKDQAKKLAMRLAALKAAKNLAVFWPPNLGPERCHELQGKLKGIFSIDLKQPYRLLFKAIEETSPLDRSDGLQRWKSITSIDIFAIENTHE